MTCAAGWPDKPVIYEINTAVWLGERSRAAGRRVTLADVSPPGTVAPDGADAVWLMGVWERARRVCSLRTRTRNCRSRSGTLPDMRPGDMIGSPYCVRRYVVDDSFGGHRASPRRGRAGRPGGAAGAGLRAHHRARPPMVTTHPEVRQGQRSRHGGGAEAWLRAGGQILARGRDPYFPPCPMWSSWTLFRPPCARPPCRPCGHRRAMRRDPLRHRHAVDR